MFYLAGDNNQGDEFNQTCRVLERARLLLTSLTICCRV